MCRDEGQHITFVGVRRLDASHADFWWARLASIGGAMVFDRV